MSPDANFRRQIRRVALVPPLILCLLSAIFFGQVVLLLSAFDRVARKDHLIDRAHETSRLLADRADGLRDHLASGSPATLRRHRETDARLGTCFDDLGRLVSGDLPQSLRLALIRKRGDLWAASASRAIAPSPGSPRQPPDPGDQARGRELMEEIRRLMAAFLEAEEGGRDRLSGEARSRSWAVLSACSGGGIALVVLLACSSSRRIGGLCHAFEDLQARYDRDESGRLDLLSKALKYYAIFTLDEEGRITSWNSDAERILGYSEGEVLSRRFSYVYGDTDSDGTQQDLVWAARDGRADDHRWIARKDGFRFAARTSLLAIRDPGGVLRGYTSVIHEVEED